MKLQDRETLSVADTVKDVLEGKKVVTEMDPKKHVSKEGDKFVVKNPKGDIVKSFDDEEAAVKYATDNHDEIMAEALKKKDEGNAFTAALKAARDNGDKTFVVSGKKYTVTEYTDEEEDEDEDEKEKEVKASYSKESTSTVIEDLFDEAQDGKEKEDDDEEEDEVDEMSDKQKKYQAFFNKALKKFKVKSPAELKGDEKTKFFDYVDANYEAEGEKAESVTITLDPDHPALMEKKLTIDVDWIGDKKQTADAAKKFKVKIKADPRQGTADITGDNKQIIKMLMDPDTYGWDKKEIETMWPQLK